MSAFMPDSQERQPSTPPKGPEEYLAPEERRFLQRYLSFPEDIPPKFKSWLIDFIAVNIPQIPISQIVGFSQFTASTARVISFQTTTSVTYTNLATTGPELPGLSKGSYLLLYGCAAYCSAAVVDVFMSVSVNGGTPSDDDACVYRSATGGSQDSASISMAVLKSLPMSGGNTVTTKYRTASGTAAFARRWLVTLKIGN